MVEAQPAGALAGSPDGFERLWVPHRLVYVQGDARPTTSQPQDCPFCRARGLDDEEGLVVARGQTVYALLNLFPYNTGHLLICPYRHVADLCELTSDESAELVKMTQLGIMALRQIRQPQGFNLGINQGAVAGAGIAAHLHQHIVPRWANDANFFPIIAQTKALPELLATTRQALAEQWGRQC